LPSTHFVENGATRTGPSSLAGHSQGALHLTHLLKGSDRGHSHREAYCRGLCRWLAGVDHDRHAGYGPARLHIAGSDVAASWAGQSYAEPAKYGRIVELYNATTGFNGESRARTRRSCAPTR
jgi:hypothetical protein